MAITGTAFGAVTSAPSSIIWDKFDFAAGLQKRDVFEFYDDFRKLHTTGLPWVIDENDATGSVLPVANEELGFLRLACTTTDNIETWAHAGSNAATMAAIDLNNGDVGYEARIRTSNIGDDTGAIAFGLCEDGLAVGNDVFQADDTGVLASSDVVGFNTVHVNGGTTGTNALLRSIHGENGTTATVLQSDALTLVADTFYKLGFYFNSQSGRVTFYKDQVALGTTVLESATNFPDGAGLVPFFALKIGSAVTVNLDADWVRVAQNRIA